MRELAANGLFKQKRSDVVAAANAGVRNRHHARIRQNVIHVLMQRFIIQTIEMAV